MKTVAGANGRVGRGLIKARTSSKEVKKEGFGFFFLIRIYRILNNVFKQRCIHKRGIIEARNSSMEFKETVLVTIILSIRIFRLR